MHNWDPNSPRIVSLTFASYLSKMYPYNLMDNADLEAKQ